MSGPQEELTRISDLREAHAELFRRHHAREQALDERLTAIERSPEQLLAKHAGKIIVMLLVFFLGQCGTAISLLIEGDRVREWARKHEESQGHTPMVSRVNGLEKETALMERDIEGLKRDIDGLKRRP